MNKLNILFTVPLNACRHDTQTVLVQVLWKSALSGKFLGCITVLRTYTVFQKSRPPNSWL